MALRDRLHGKDDESKKKLVDEYEATEPFGGSDLLNELKMRIHRQLIDKIDLANVTKIDGVQARDEIRKIIQDLIEVESVPLTVPQKRQLAKEIENEAFGLGPLEPLLSDPTIDDILVNGPKQVYIERFGKLELTKVVFRDGAHLKQVVDRIVSQVGRRVDEASPMVDARLSDGSRINVIIAPLALDGPVVSIRRFKKDPLTIKDLLTFGSLSNEIVLLLEATVKAKLNILISGGTGSGKTTLLNVISSFVPNSERIITIEDASELRLRKAHVIRLETRPPNIEGKGEVAQRDLVRNSLRMRPDRIIVGEVRGPEAIDMLQAMNTGHKGSLTTIHANTPRDALARLETMILMAGLNLTSEAMRRQVAAAIDIVIQLERCVDGVRRCMSISELVGMEGDVIRMQDIFLFKARQINQKGEVVGDFIPTGIQPACYEKIKEKGIVLPLNIFMPKVS
ncbi:MAG: CpaF family protein [Candidatus Omnitrophica bacterium]|nr:CpaF family protein [Candidatus Omnitrophota bacterium]